MAYVFGDGFDCYATINDPTLGYWDSGTPGGSTLVAGRFGGQAWALPNATIVPFTKSSGQNDAVHHITVAYRQTAALSGSTTGLYFQLVDNVTNQVCITFRSDGVILLTSATTAGTVLATYSGAVTAPNTWFAFEFEVVISNTVGRFRARKNGNTVDDYDSLAAVGNINTRPGTNSYANKLNVGQTPITSGQQFDDLLWRSDAASVPFVGDIRCYTRMPASDASIQFARSPSPSTITVGLNSTASDPTGTSRYTPFTPAFSGTVGTISITVNTGFTGNMKCSIFADIGGFPGAVLGSATTLVNPASGPNLFTFGTPVAVSKGVQYWFGYSHDVTVTVSTGPLGTGGKSSTTVSYAAFPTASPTVNNNTNLPSTVSITPTISAEFVGETLQDGTTSYVYDSTAGHADFYNLAALTPQPASVVAVTTRGFIEKSDAGTRTGTVQIKSGGTTVAAPTVTLSTSFGWAWRTDTTNPAGGAWTASAVDACTIGPAVVA